MSNNNILYDNLSGIFSEARFSSYIKAVGHDKLKVLELYKLNIKISKALYPLFCVFEVTLRNRIVNVLVRCFGNNWFDEKDEL